jgi:hypothetical protein
MITVNFGTPAVATAVTILAPSLAMPPASYLRPTLMGFDWALASAYARSCAPLIVVDSHQNEQR